MTRKDGALADWPLTTLLCVALLCVTFLLSRCML